MSEPKKVTEADCAYLASLIDRCAKAKVRRERRRGTTYRTIVLQFSGVPDEVAIWLGEKFGPLISVPRQVGNEITFVSKTAAQVCVHAYPYLLVMKDVARLVTRFVSSLGTRRVPTSPENEAIRAEVDRELEAIERSREEHR